MIKPNLTKIAVAALLGATLLPLSAQAAPHHKPIDRRERHQEVRIRNGVRSGRLTRSEAVRLQEQQARIRRQEAQARRSGGRYTPEERRRIQRQLNNSSNTIGHQKHDHQHR